MRSKAKGNRWPDNQKEERHIDLFYHLSDFFDVRCFIQNETSREGGNLTWEKLVEEAKCQECVGKEYAKFRRENSGSGTPSYRDQALAADAISRGYKKPQQRSLTPSGGKGGNSQKQCDRCGRHNGCTGEKGTCPAWVGSVAFAKARIITRQSVRRLLKGKQEEASNPSSRSKGKANPLARMEKRKPKCSLHCV